ncbi:LBP / BPI / CETP familyN-terminal domain containing protein [Aphelenchoides avenae]|nr:LBP / BPI / CETP familyN-terminal domain containing protein [Aphelenchus avenae]
MGCIIVTNAYVSRYCPPRRIVLYPACPNRIVLAIEGLDIGVTGNLGGQINILIPINLFGIVQLNIHQLSITVALVVDRGPTGAPYLRVDSCNVQFGYLDVYIQNGGFIGDLANTMFRGMIIQMVGKQIPEQLCGQVPSLVNERINSKLGGIPQSISLTQILQIASSSFDLNSLFSGLGSSGSDSGGQCSSAACQQQCGSSAPSANALPAPQASAYAPPVAAPPPSAPVAALPPPASASYDQAQLPVAAAPPPPPLAQAPPPALYQETVPAQESQAPHAAPPPPPDPPAPESYQETAHVAEEQQLQCDWYETKSARFEQKTVLPVRTFNRHIGVLSYRGKREVVHAGTSNRTRRQCGNDCPTDAASAGINIDNGPDPCVGCPKCQGSPVGILQSLLSSLDLSKLSNIYLTIQLLQSYATCNDYTIELNGEFSPYGRGGTPFGAFPMYFPSPVGDKMAEVLVSDWTINTLFYHLHRHKKKAKRSRHKRQDCCAAGGAGGAGGALGELGICLGDVFPGLSKYPNERLVLVIRTSRAPSVQLSACNGGLASGDIAANVDFYLESSNQHIATISIYASFLVALRVGGSRLVGSLTITQLKITEPTNSLGIQQKTLDQFGALGKELISKAGNDFLGKGISLKIPSGVGGLPINFVDPEVRILDHALWIGSDFTVDPSALNSLGGGGGGCGGGGCGGCRKLFYRA